MPQTQIRRPRCSRSPLSTCTIATGSKRLAATLVKTKTRRLRPALTIIQVIRRVVRRYDSDDLNLALSATRSEGEGGAKGVKGLGKIGGGGGSWARAPGGRGGSKQKRGTGGARLAALLLDHSRLEARCRGTKKGGKRWEGGE